MLMRVSRGAEALKQACCTLDQHPWAEAARYLPDGKQLEGTDLNLSSKPQVCALMVSRCLGSWLICFARCINFAAATCREIAVSMQQLRIDNVKGL